MKSLLSTFLLLFILFITVSASCEGDDADTSYSNCKDKGSDCCYVILYYNYKGDKDVRKCVDESSVSSFISKKTKEIKDDLHVDINQKSVQCSSNLSNYLIFDLLYLIILFCFIVY